MMRRGLTVVLPVLVLLVGCRAQEEAGPPPDQSLGAALGPPTLEELRNATYRGFDEMTGPVDLVEGRWAGAPFQEGGASRPRVVLIRDFYALGDLDDDGVDEAVVFLAYSSGGSGTSAYMAVVARQGEALVNVATTRLGDRLQVRAVRFEDGRLLIDEVRAGPGDPACCPGELATEGFVLEGERLEPFDPGVAPARLSLESLGGEDWVLRWWGWEEQAPEEPRVTLRLEGGRFTGISGCNSFTAAVRETGETPGSLEVGPAAGTMMACPDPAGEIERRFLGQLEGVDRFGFMIGDLMLSYATEEGRGLMLFERPELESESGI